MITTFRVRKYVTSYSSMKGKVYYSFKFACNGQDWTIKEIEECEKISFIFLKSVNQEDIDKINLKWKHKLL